MVIEVIVDVFREFIAGTSKSKKLELELGGELTTPAEGQRCQRY